jgi:serine/threonine protein kinase
MKLAWALLPGVDDVFQERYRIVAEIGSGGFGTVYKAVQLATGQQVAIKVLRPVGVREAKNIEKRIARLEREMRLCAQLHHPNIVGLIDFGRTQDGSVYSVFEFIPGKNLEEVLAEEGALEPVEARHLMLQVLDALACAHAQGVIHRDLKPSNIMVISTGARRNALVLDFGIGVVTDAAPGMNYARLTATNEVLGTVAYSSPEQLFGKPTAPASDIYSWGLVFLECLTGAPVVHGASMMDALFKQMAGAELTMPPVLQEHALGRLIRAAAAKTVEERPASARELMRRLEQCELTGLRREDLARPPSQSNADDSIPPLPDDSEDRQPSGPVEPISKTKPVEKTRPVELVPEPTVASKIELLREEASPDERRQVTAVCATLSVASTDEGSLDIDEADQLLGAGQETCTRIAARFRGHPIGAMGHQTLFWFGFPSADEDDARRAARAALEMIAEIERERAKPQTSKNAWLEVRIGIHTGIVVSRSSSGPGAQRLAASFGTTSNIAAQLSAATAPTDIFVSGATQQLLRQHFSFTALGARKLAAQGVGSAQSAVDVYRLGLPLSTVHAVAAEHPDTPMVGRGHEIELLLQRWNEVRRGSGRVVLITGEAGIGKSRLVRELASRATCRTAGSSVVRRPRTRTARSTPSSTCSSARSSSPTRRPRPRSSTSSRRCCRAWTSRSTTASRSSRSCSASPSTASTTAMATATPGTRSRRRCSRSSSSTRSSRCSSSSPRGRRSCSWPRICNGRIRRRSSSFQ